MRITKWIFFGYLAAIVLMVAGIGLSFTVKPPRDPDTLYTAFVSQIKSLDPAIVNDVEAAGIIGNVYECLLNYEYGKREPYELYPQLAEEMPKISDDGLTYRIKPAQGRAFLRSVGKGL